MNNDRHIENCDLDIEMMAYIYGELAEAEKAPIDSHLATCGSCTDAFAEMSMSRFSVYEWKREEFDPVATPNFVIPYEPVVESAGWFLGLRGLFAGWPSAVAFASIAVVFIGTGLFALNYLGGNDQVAFVTAVETKREAPGINLVQPVESLPTGKPVSPITATLKNKAREPRVVEAKAVVKKTDKINDGSTRAVVIPENKKPRLSNLDDDDDDTLRLADLFEEGGV